MPAISWSDQDDMELIDLVSKGLSARAIGAEINKSRNAVLGRIYRLRKVLKEPLKIGDMSCQYTRGRYEAMQRKAAGLPRKTAKSGWERWRDSRRAEGFAAKLTEAALKAAATKLRNARRNEVAKMSMRNHIVCCGDPKLIWTLQIDDCRWLITDDDLPSGKFYCANITEPGKSYCSAHQRLATERVPGTFVPLKTNKWSIGHPWKTAGRAA